jgi:hypothetical protein
MTGIVGASNVDPRGRAREPTLWRRGEAPRDDTGLIGTPTEDEEPMS